MNSVVLSLLCAWVLCEAEITNTLPDATAVSAIIDAADVECIMPM